MPTRHDNIAKVRSELAALHDVGGLNDRRLALGLRYVTENEDEIAEMVDAEGVRATVDNIIDVAMSCPGGRCE